MKGAGANTPRSHPPLQLHALSHPKSRQSAGHHVRYTAPFPELPELLGRGALLTTTQTHNHPCEAETPHFLQIRGPLSDVPVLRGTHLLP